MKPTVTLAPILALFLASCGGRATAPSDSIPANGTDASVSDADLPDGSVVQDGALVDSTVVDSAVPDAFPPPDADPGEFCANVPKAQHAGVLVAPAPVTSSLLVMDCCDGFFLRFHTRTQLGFDVSVMEQHFGLLTSGDYVFPVDGGPSRLLVQNPDEPYTEDATVTGTMHLEVSSPYDQPTRVSVCLDVSAPGQSIDGTRLFASDMPVAPWGWQNRFEVRLLADPGLTADQAAQVPLESLELSTGEPVIHLLSFAWYEASTHTAYWDSWYSGEAILNQLPDVGVFGLPFVVLADGQRIYLGAFMSMVSSFSLDMPVIVVESMTDESFTIEPGYPGGGSGNDPRGDPRILELLSNAGKLAP